MKNKNKILGNHFESEFCSLLAENGFWVHNIAQNQTGQPADVIAVKDNIAYLIDCKVCSNNKFSLSRIEPNQEGAMTLWKMRGNTNCYFALKLTDGEIYMLHFDEILSHNSKSINKEEMKKYRSFKEWLEEIKCTPK